jgi:hypothetical protein
MLREVKKKRSRRKRGPKVMMMRLRMTHTCSPLSLLAAMGRGQLKRRLITSPIPRRATKPPTFNKAERPLVHLPSINKELQPTFVPKPLLGSFPLFH